MGADVFYIDHKVENSRLMPNLVHFHMLLLLIGIHLMLLLPAHLAIISPCSSTQVIFTHKHSPSSAVVEDFVTYFEEKVFEGHLISAEWAEKGNVWKTEQGRRKWKLGRGRRREQINLARLFITVLLIYPGKCRSQRAYIKARRKFAESGREGDVGVWRPSNRVLQKKTLRPELLRFRKVSRVTVKGIDAASKERHRGKESQGFFDHALQVFELLQVLCVYGPIMSRAQRVMWLKQLNGPLPACFSSFSTRISACSFITSKKSARMEKWKDTSRAQHTPAEEEGLRQLVVVHILQEDQNHRVPAVFNDFMKCMMGFESGRGETAWDLALYGASRDSCLSWLHPTEPLEWRNASKQRCCYQRRKREIQGSHSSSQKILSLNRFLSPKDSRVKEPYFALCVCFHINAAFPLKQFDDNLMYCQGNKAGLPSGNPGQPPSPKGPRSLWSFGSS
ncbi:hypothetical protein INR49_032806 [Caranx melampygus]|nr:hypothetical protein INR49_032806 [Caranx melampygus]